MIYIFDPRKEIKPSKQTFDFGDVYQISFGEKGRGRKLMSLTCSENTILKSGMNDAYTIGFTRSGKPKIVEKKDEKIYIILSAQGGYTRRGNGTIEVPITERKITKSRNGVMYDKYNNNSNINCMAIGNGADGDAGRIGYWDVALLEVVGNTTIRVRTSGGGYGTPADYFIVNNGKILHCEGNTALVDYFDNGGVIPKFQEKFLDSPKDGFINITNIISGINGLQQFD